jgi:PAS domain S-box-containing protein
MQKLTQILVIDNSSEQFLLFQKLFSQPELAGTKMIRAASVQEVLGIRNSIRPEIIFLDLSLPDSSGLESYLTVQKLFPLIPVIVLSKTNDTEAALQSLQAGAQDYLVTGGFDKKLLLKSIQYSIERKHGQLKLEESNQRYEWVFKATNDPFWDWNILTGEINWNDKVNIFGFPETISKDVSWWVSNIHPDDVKRITVDLNDLLDSDRLQWSCTYRFRCMDGEYKYILDRSYVLRDNSNRAFRMIGSMQDISELKIAEEELLESRKKFQNLVENIPGVYWVTDMETFQTLYISPSYETIWGRKCTDLYNNPGDFIDSIHPDDKESVFKAYNTINDTLSSEITYRIIRPDGEIRWIAVKAKVVADGVDKKTEYGYAEDITERKIAELEFEKLATIVRNSPEFIGVASLDLKGMYVNESGKKMMGITGDVSTTSIQEYFTEADFEIIQKTILPAIQEKGRWVGELHFRNFQTGERIPMLLDGFFIYHPVTREPVALATVTTNITEYKKDQEKLRMAYQRLSNHLNNSPLGIIEWDKNFVIKKWSAQAENIFGWCEQDAVNKHFNDLNLVFEEDAPAVAVIAHELMTGIADRNRITNRNKTKTGGLIYCQWFNSVLKDENNNIVSILSLIQEITEQKNAELKLIQLSQAVEQSPATVVITDTKGEMQYVNPKFTQLTGYTAEEAIGKNPRILKSGYTPTDEYGNLWERITSGLEWRGEFHNVKKNGELYFESAIISPIFDSKGGITNFLAVKEDITERKKVEQELNQSYEQIRQLTAHLQNVREEERISIAHEIHDVLGHQLTALKMDISSLFKNTVDDDEMLSKKYKKLMDLTDETISLARKMSLELRPSVLDDLGLVMALESHCREFEKRSGINTRFESELSNLQLPPKISIGLFRIFQESLANISLHAGAGEVKASLTANKGKLSMVISDNGKGFRLSEIKSKKTLGMLGMRERATMMGGEYKVISEPGKGTVVEIVIPYASTVQY